MTKKNTEAKPDKPAAALDSFSLSAGQKPVEIPAGQGPPSGVKTVSVGSGSSIYWAKTPDVLADPHELAPGESLKITGTIYVATPGNARVTVTQQERPVADHPARAK